MYGPGRNQDKPRVASCLAPAIERQISALLLVSGGTTFHTDNMLSKIRVHLQQFDIIHLPNPDLTYIRNLERNKIMLIPFHLLKTYIRNPSLLFISFFTLPPTEKRRWQPWSACAYMHMGRWIFAKFYFYQVGLQNCWRPIFLVLPKLDGCQVSLPNCWSCSKCIIWLLALPCTPWSGRPVSWSVGTAGTLIPRLDQLLNDKV
jgi:hypothetical protein